MSKSNFTKLFIMVLVLAVALPSIGVFAQEGSSVFDIIANSEEHTLLATLIPMSGLDLAGAGEITVFAPTDAALDAVPDLVVGAVLEDAEFMATLLSYHVVPGAIMSGDLAEGCVDVETLFGATLAVCKSGDTVTVNSAIVTTADLTADNGVVHVIDAMVIPPVEMPFIDPLDWEGEIITAGSSTVGPLSIAIASRWADEGGVDVPTVDIIGSGAGFSRFCESAETDISNASRGIKASEIETCENNGRTPIEFRVGTDAIAVAVSAENDFVDDLSMEELTMIFSGQVVTWADINADWPAETIELFSPGTDSGTFDFFVEEVLDEDAGALLGASPQLSENDDVLVEGVAGSPYAIGYFGYAYYLQNQDVLKVLSLNGVVANGVTVDNGDYALARPLYIYGDATIMHEKPQVAAFIGYYLTVVDEEIGDVGYFPAAADALNLARLQWLVVVEGMEAFAE